MTESTGPAGPQLHMGAEHQGTSGMWVVCSCGKSTAHYSRRPSGAIAAWNEHYEHALIALREAVSVAYQTR
jgi:hypothetical protein